MDVVCALFIKKQVHHLQLHFFLSVLYLHETAIRDRHTTFENKIGALKICFCLHIAGIPVCTDFNQNNFFCSMHTCEGYKQL